MRKHLFCQEHNNPKLLLLPGHLEAAVALEMPQVELITNCLTQIFAVTLCLNSPNYFFYVFN